MHGGMSGVRRRLGLGFRDLGERRAFGKWNVAEPVGGATRLWAEIVGRADRRAGELLRAGEHLRLARRLGAGGLSQTSCGGRGAASSRNREEAAPPRAGCRAGTRLGHAEVP